MIITEYLNNGALIKHYSDKGVMLLQKETGVMYSEPVDIVPCRYTYIETNVFIDAEDDDDEEITGDDFIDLLEEVL